jgi:hypothetical protein
VNASKAHDPDANALVILPPQHITLPEVLRHIEAGKIVLVILTPGTKAQPKQDRPLSQGI